MSRDRPEPEPAKIAVSGSRRDRVLRCIRDAETNGPMNGRWDYRATNTKDPVGYYGGYQFSTGTWNGVAERIKRKDLIGVRPDRASPADQDLLGWALYKDRGLQPWGLRARANC